MHQVRRTLAAAVSVIVLTASGTAAAHADDSNVLYVDNLSTACTDSGNGAEATPFCTIQAAADAVTAGDTVDVEGGSYQGALDITSVGTAAAPIVFALVGGNVSILDAPGQTGPALSFDGASYVTFRGLPRSGATQNSHVTGVLVDDSSHVTLDTAFVAAAKTGDAVHVTGDSSDVTLSRDDLAAVVVDPGSTGDVITTNEVIGVGPHYGISMTDDPNAVITSNSIDIVVNSVDGIDVSGASTGTSIENNIVNYANESTTPGSGAAISLDATSVPGSTVDYNVVGAGQNAAYSWAGTDYSTSAAFNQATGQGAHDSSMGPDFNTFPFYKSSPLPQINSANSDAPGMLGTDMYGQPCVGDPVVAVTGAGSPAYCARGAVQESLETTVQAAAYPVQALGVNLGSTMVQTLLNGGEWGFYPKQPAVSYTVNWGDGVTQTFAASTDSTATASAHTYAKPGTYTITDTADLSTGGTTATTVSFTTAGSDFTPYGPARILDTRHGIGAPVRMVATGSYVKLQVAGVGSIPAGVTAVAVNLTATDGTAAGFLAAVADGSGVASSNVNYLKGQTVANNAFVPVAPDGAIDVYNEGAAGASADLIADISGYFTQATVSGYTPVAPKRLLDTRHAIGAPTAKVRANTGLPVTVVGADSIPAGVTAVALHVAVTDTSGGGWIAAEPDGAGVPGTSILNYGAGQTLSNTVIVPVAADGRIELYNGGGATPVDLVADVSGYFSAASRDVYMPLTPYRAWDSRHDGTGLTPDGTNWYPLETDAQTAVVSADVVVTNLTVTDVGVGGDLTVYPTGTARPAVSDLSFASGRTTANLGLVAQAPSYEAIDVYNASAAHGDLILDVFGYFTHS